MSFTSQSDVNDHGVPCNLMISLKKNLEILRESNVFFHGIKYFVFEKLSTTTITESNAHLVLDIPKIKSKRRSYHIEYSTDKGKYNPVFWDVPLLCWQIKHCSNNMFASLLIFYQKKWACIRRRVLSRPTCHTKPPMCNSLMRSCLRDVLGIHNLFPLNK